MKKNNEKLTSELISSQQKMAAALIQGSPDHLKSIEIELSDSGETISISASNPEDYFSPTDELITAANEFETLLRNHNLMFESAIFRVYLDENSRWKYELNKA